jgi:RHH-type proline utilization regulon transcriptional repressor/proline dehydrogenase/delta 1-pyrroline-5-carboxylate dehydrogenase
LKVTNHKIHKLKNFNQLFTDFDPDTVIRSLATRLPKLFQQECHTKNIHIYKKKPSENGRMELLNYLTEQSLSINYHRYGNLMGETSIKD